MLSFLSLAVVYHRIYDYVVLIFSLFFIFDNQQKVTGLKSIIIICLFLTWFFDAFYGYYLAQKIPNNAFTYYIFNIYYWLDILIFYTCLFLSFRQITSRKNHLLVSLNQ